MSECEEVISQAEKGLIPITIDLIRELREKGYDYQAQMLLEAYHTNKKNNNLQFKKELDRVAFRIHNFEYRKNHPDAIKAWKERARIRKANKKKCQGCHKSFRVPRLKLCPTCKEKHYKQNTKRAEKKRIKKLLESKVCKGCGKSLRITRLQFHPECRPSMRGKPRFCLYCKKELFVKHSQFHPECLVKHQSQRHKEKNEKKKKSLEVEHGLQV